MPTPDMEQNRQRKTGITMITTSCGTIGHNAEQQAQRFLQKQGLKRVTQNYRCRSGEIDLIMRDGKTLVFVEVRARNNNYCGTALESITPAKVKRISKAAQHYLTCNAKQNHAARFDVVAIEKNATINWIKNAFEVE